MIELVVAVNNLGVLRKNLMASPCLNQFSNIIYKHGYTNIPKAYNEAKTTEKIVVYAHQDVFLPDSFYNDLLVSLRYIKNWDVLGVAGVILNGKKENYGYILDRGKIWGKSFTKPVRVDTLDELLLITKGDIKFDEQFEQDFYCADICIGRKCYVIPAFVHHNSSRKVGQRTESFYRSEKLFRQKHIDNLPIVTTCSLIS